MGSISGILITMFAIAFLLTNPLILILCITLFFILAIPYLAILLYSLPFFLSLDKDSFKRLICPKSSNPDIAMFQIYFGSIKIFFLATKTYLCWLTFRHPKKPTVLFSLTDFFENFNNKLDSINSKMEEHISHSKKDVSKIKTFNYSKNNFEQKVDNWFNNWNAKMDERIAKQLARNERDKARIKAFFS